jgi:hypothetical protein
MQVRNERALMESPARMENGEEVSGYNNSGSAGRREGKAADGEEDSLGQNARCVVDLCDGVLETERPRQQGAETRPYRS